MKKVYLLLCIISLLVLGGCTYIDSQELRIRILPNSNSDADQKEKEMLKLALFDIFKNEKVEINDIELLERLLREKNLKLTYEYKVELKNVTFPSKTKNGNFIPSGTYKTLLITIGEGRGDNWWSVLYPDFFGVEFESEEEIEYRSYIYDLLNN